MRRIVENGFGQLTQRFRRFMSILEFSPKKSTSIILSATILHNFLQQTNSTQTRLDEMVNIQRLILTPRRTQTGTVRGQIFRDRFVNYFARERQLA